MQPFVPDSHLEDRADVGQKVWRAFGSRVCEVFFRHRIKDLEQYRAAFPHERQNVLDRRVVAWFAGGVRANPKLLRKPLSLHRSLGRDNGDEEVVRVGHVPGKPQRVIRIRVNFSGPRLRSCEVLQIALACFAG